MIFLHAAKHEIFLTAKEWAHVSVKKLYTNSSTWLFKWMLCRLSSLSKLSALVYCFVFHWWMTMTFRDKWKTLELQTSQEAALLSDQLQKNTSIRFWFSWRAMRGLF